MCSENKGADQLCSYCTPDLSTPDLSLCFRIGKKNDFLILQLNEAIASDKSKIAIYDKVHTKSEHTRWILRINS